MSNYSFPTMINLESVIKQYAGCTLSKRQMLNYFNEAAKQTKTTAGSLLFEYYNKIEKAKKTRALVLGDRNLEVVYICGPSGSGKTTIAKYYANKLNYDYFVSGSGDDFLDGYDKEECIILDDFRAGSMRFSEMLKFLDNNTGSSVKSRYYNKDINNCKVLFITTVYKPIELYKNLFTNEDGSTNQEPIEQFFRRIKHHYFEITSIVKDGEELELLLEHKTDELEKPIVRADIKAIFNELGIDKKKVDDTSIMEGLFTYGKKE